MTGIRIFCAGAAKGLVEILAARFEAETGLSTTRLYGPVGAMVDKLRAGESADVAILSDKALDELAASGVTMPGAAPLGRVVACVAVRADDPLLPLATAEDMREAFIAADAIHLPDPAVATSGAHLVQVFRALGIAEEVTGRLRVAGNGIAAMSELAASTARRPIGCTQASEIALVEGVRIVAPLPGEHALTTLYAGALTKDVVDLAAAERFVALMVGEEAASLRVQMGFQAA